MERVGQQVNTPETVTARLGRVDSVLTQLREKEKSFIERRKPNDHRSWNEIGVEFARKIIEAALGDQPESNIVAGPLRTHLDFKDKGDQSNG